MFDPAKIGEEIFGTLRSFNYAVVLFDEEGNKTTEPGEARRFFTDKRNITVSVYEDGENSALHIYLGRSVDIQSVQGLLDTLRRCATKFGVLFNCRKYRRELAPKDFANGSRVLESMSPRKSPKSGSQYSSWTAEGAAKSPEEIDGIAAEIALKLTPEEIKAVTQHRAGVDYRTDWRVKIALEKWGITTGFPRSGDSIESFTAVGHVVQQMVGGVRIDESRKLTGSTKSSYLKLEGAKMILRHDSAIDDKKHGARARNVRKVFVENSDGERFLMPSQNLMAGRAMTRHVSKGGHFHDDRGTKIAEMALEQQQMKNCASYCRRNKKLDEDVSEIIEACTERAKTLRNTFEGLFRRYDKAIKEMEKQTDDMLLEDDDELMEEKVAYLKKKLQLEDESVVDRPTCEKVVRMMEGRPKKVEMIHLPAFDCDVEKDAWEQFKNGSINFIKGTAPDVTPAGKNLSAGLSLIAAQTSDDALANLFAKVAQWLEDGQSDVLFKHVATRAITIARDHSVKADATPLVKTPSKDMERVAESAMEGLAIINESVKALEAWFEGFDAEKVFEDDWGSTYPKSNPSEEDYANGLDASISAVENDFNVDDFFVMSGDDFNYGDTGLSDEDKIVDVSDLLSSLKHYLNGEVESEMSGRVEVGHDDFGDLSDIAKRVLPQVVDKLEEEGYTVTGQETLETDEDGLAVDADSDLKFDDRMLDETSEKTDWKAPLELQDGTPVTTINDHSTLDRERDQVVVRLPDGSRRYVHYSQVRNRAVEETGTEDGTEDNEQVLLGGEELSSEDVVIDSNPSDDLKNDVAAPRDAEEEVEEDDTAYINRLLSLAGRK